MKNAQFLTKQTFCQVHFGMLILGCSHFGSCHFFCMNSSLPVVLHLAMINCRFHARNMQFLPGLSEIEISSQTPPDYETP
jgi:hypothetical protein